MSKKHVIVGVSALVLGFGGSAWAEGDETSKGGEQAQGTESKDVGEAAAGQASAGQMKSVELSKDQKKQLQRELQNRGHYQGEIDGIIGPQTRAALKEFQEQQNLTSSGEADQQTLSALGLDLSERQPVAGSDTAMQGEAVSGERAQSFQLSALNEEQTRELQQKLQGLGYYRGEVDGKVGPMTRSALRRYFNAQANLAARGMVSESALNVFGLEASEIQPVGGADQPAPSQGAEPQPDVQQPSEEQQGTEQPSEEQQAPEQPSPEQQDMQQQEQQYAP